MSATTFGDIIDNLVDYLGGDPAYQAKRDCVRAALAAYREFSAAFNWTYFYKWGRLMTNGSYGSTVDGSTIQYQISGGTYPNQVTISGGTWPEWAAEGTLRIGGAGSDVPSTPYDSVYNGPMTTSVVAYRVKDRISATVLTLVPELAPFVDMAAGTEYLIYQDTYLLPEDFMAQDQGLYELNFGGMTYSHPRDWLYENRYIFGAGVPQFYTIKGDQKHPGRLVMCMFPWPFESKSIDFIYKRHPRPLRLINYNTGTVAGTAAASTVAGTSTVWTPTMAGATLRLSSNSTPPTSLAMMTNPYAFETIIKSQINATGLNLEDPLNASYSGVAYTISDTIDIEPGAMLDAYCRCCEKQIGMMRVLKDKPSARLQYEEALRLAKSADSRSFQMRSVGDQQRYRPRLRDMPQNLNVIN